MSYFKHGAVINYTYKGIKMEESIKKYLYKENLEISLDVLGEIELRNISLGDIKRYLIILEKGLQERDFACEVLYNQIAKPKFSFDKFKLLPNDVLINLIEVFKDYQKDKFQCFQNTGNSFNDFQLAIKTYTQKSVEDLEKLFEVQIKAAQESLSLFSGSFSSIIQQSINEKSYIGELLEKAGKFVSQMKEISEAALKSVQPAIEQYIRTANIIAQSLQPQIILWNKWIDQNSNVLINAARYWKEFEYRYKIAEKQAISILKKYKWFITPGLPFDFVIEVVKVGNKKGRQDKAINRLYTDYFSRNNWRNLEKLVDDWQDKGPIKRRWKILRDCVLALKKIRNGKINEANVILPTLITQIDGILSDYLISKDIIWKVAYDDHIVGSKIIKVGRKSQYTKNKSSVLNPDLDNLANDIFLNILFQKAQKGKPLKTPFNFNRHKILHGENVKYGKKDYLIRAFLVIDFLANLK